MQVKRVEVLYDDFDQFTKDQEFLISKGEVDYLEGSINIQVNTLNVSRNEPTESGQNPSYSIELAIYYNDRGTVQKVHHQLCCIVPSFRHSVSFK